MSSREISFYSGFVSDHKKQLFRKILSFRTRYLTVVLEDLYQPQNASAVLRSCDGFGVQDVHIIENRNVFGVDKGVTIGSDKWLSLFRYRDPDVNNTEAAYRELRDRGYHIIATTPDDRQQSIADFHPCEPVALVFGAEKTGLSDYAKTNADSFLYIPMYGFSESFNISVSVAVCLYQLRGRIMGSELPWQLSDQEKQELYLQWLRKSIRRLKALEQKYREILDDEAKKS